MGLYSGWMVAAAVLVFRNAAMEYKKLASVVDRTRLSGLGERGGEETLHKTLRTAMDQYPSVFEGHGGRTGFYQTNDEAALQFPEVRRICDTLRTVDELMQTLGGPDQAKTLIDAVEKLGGPNRAKEIIDMIQMNRGTVQAIDLIDAVSLSA